MSRNSFSLIHKISHLPKSLLSLSIVLLFQTTAASAHELRPAIIDFGVLDGASDQLTIDLTFSGEAFLANIDLSTLSDTDDSANAGLEASTSGFAATTFATIVFVL